MKKWTAVALVVLAVSSPALAQRDWLQPLQSTTPGQRTRPAVGYDAQRDRVVMFGGADSTGAALADLWEWDGCHWAQIFTSGTASAGRYGANFVYDTRRRQLVLVGGTSCGNTAACYFRDTWTYQPSSNSWMQLSTTGGPFASDPATAYDVARDRIVAYGGGTNTGRSADTLEFDPSTNTWSAPSTVGPGNRSEMQMIYDAPKQRIIMFGGIAPSNVFQNDTWQYAGGVWTQLTIATRPPVRGLHSFVMDPVRNIALMHGGVVGSTALSDTWEFDPHTDTWAQLTPSNPSNPRYATDGVFVGSTGELLVASGAGGPGNFLTDTWVYGPGNRRNCCPADFNNDGVIDFFDYLDFVLAFSSGSC